MSDVSSMLNSKLRLSGLSSGLDTDSMIQKLMNVEKMKVDKVKQDRQLLEWQRDGYRDITNILRGFKDDYFNVAKSSTNFKSTSAFSAYNSSSSDSAVLTATAGSGATTGSYSVVVGDVAKTAVKQGAGGVSKGYAGATGANPVDMSEMKEGKSFALTLDGVARTITLDQDYTGFTAANFAAQLDTLVDAAFGAGKINVTESGGALTFAPALVSSTLNISDSTNTYLSTLGLANGQTNAIASIDISDFTGGQFKIAIDSDAAVSVDVDDATDRDDFVQKINDALADAGVDGDVMAVADPADADKIKFVTLDTAKKVTFTSGGANDMLSRLGINSGSAINPMNGSITYGTNDIGKDFNIQVDDGVPIKIELAYNYSSDAYTDADGKTLEEVIQDQLDANGANITVSISGGKISFSSLTGSQITVQKGDDGLKAELGFSSTQSGSRISLTSKLSDATLATAFDFSGGPDLAFTINGKSFTANKDETLGNVISRINSSDAGVKIKYDSMQDKFTLESKDVGSTSYINNTDDTGNFFAALKLDTTAEVRGTNATLTIDGTPVERTTNKFTIDGVAYDIKKTGTSTVTVEGDPDALIDKIKGFVNKYNEVISKINGELSEKHYRDYTPLTDDQKKAMEQKDIDLWDEKAKSGLLRSDPILSKITESMRRALSDSVSGAGLSLHDIGIDTSSSYTDKGRLVITEAKLSQAIKDNPDKISELFTKESSYIYDDVTNRASRYKEEGLAQRLSDIIDDNIRTTRDSSGKKGFLLEKAGIEGDMTEFTNIIGNEIKDKDKLIDSFIDKLLEKEDMYYQKFSAMERILSQMNSQSAWLSQQLGQG